MNNERFYKALEKEIAQRVGFMNNAKWHKLIELLEEYKFNHLEIKLLLDDKIIKNFDFAYVGETYCDTIYGAFYLKEIEWICIPKTIEKERFNRDEKLQSSFKTNDLDDFEQKLNKLGQFHYEKDKNGLMIYGYK